MPSGGHARSGPTPTPGSGRSDARGLNFKSLPAEGYRGPIPDFPQPVVFGSEPTYWAWAWRTPQAALWATPQWSYMVLAVADWCSLKARAEDPQAPVAVMQSIRQREDDILLTVAALARAGYTVAVDELAQKRDEPAKAVSARDRAKALRAVGDA